MIKKLSDFCLTVEQTKELNELGFGIMNTSLFHYGDQKRGYELVINDIGIVCATRTIIPTLSNSEMITILQNNFDKYRLEIIVVQDFFYVKYLDKFNHVVHLKDMVMDAGRLLDKEDVAVSVGNSTLRDSLFSMLFFLQTNKLIRS